MTFGARLRELRKGSELTQKELARALGIDATYLSKLERGRKQPSEDLIENVAAEFDANAAELLLLAGRVPDNLREALLRDPQEIERLLRAATKRPSSGERLYDDILAGLESVTDGDLFERCACSLLRDQYSALASWPGGSDGGVDGVIADEGGQVILAVTISPEVSQNLQRSIKSYLKREGRARRVVVATTQRVSPPHRRKLEKTAADLEFTLLNVHGREDFAELLYRDPRWLSDLLGLAGEPSALSVFPRTTRPQIVDMLVGREGDIERLKAMPGDVVVVGRPGIGKTALLRELALSGWGRFLVDRDPTNIARALRREQPDVVIVDDARLQVDALETLVHLRAQESAYRFRIVAACWSGDEDLILNALGLASGAAYQVEPLTQDEIVEVVASVGVRGPGHLVNHIVKQARGRPGLAAVLAYLVLQQGYRDVVSGDAVKRFLKLSWTQDVTSRTAQMLALFSLGGDRGVTREFVASALGVSLGDVYAGIAPLAVGGVVDETPYGSEIVVWPETLRYALIREVFYSSGPLLPVEMFDSFPNRAALARTLVRAKHHGLSIPEDLLWTLVQATGAAYPEYAALGPEHARRLIEFSPRSVLNIASEGLVQAPHVVIPRLMALGEGDTRGIPQTPEHPLRKIEDWITYAPRDTGESIQRRRTLVDEVIRWSAEGGDTLVSAKSLAIAMSARLRTGSLDPGSGRRYSWSQGYLEVENIAALKDIWSDALPVLSTLDRTGLRFILDAITHYVHPTSMPVPTSDDVADELRSVACSMLTDLSTVAASMPGILYEVRQFSRSADCDLQIELEHDYEIVYPQRLPSDVEDWQALQQRQLQAIGKLAEQYSELAPSEVAVRFEHFVSEAPRNPPVTLSHPVFTLATEIARLVDNLGEWITAILERHSIAWLAGPFLNRLVSDRDPSRVRWLRVALDHPVSEQAAVHQVLQDEDAPAELVEEVLQRMPKFAEMVHVMCLRGEVPSVIAEKLLAHADPRVASGVATGLWYSYDKGDIPPEIESAWRAAVLRGPVGFNDLGTVLGKDSELARDWLVARSRDRSIAESLVRHDFAVGEACKALTAESRVAVLRALVDTFDDVHWFLVHELAQAVIADDEEAFRAVLADKELRRCHLLGLTGKPGANWRDLAVIALDAGYDTEDVVRAAYDVKSMGWTGDESAMWQEWMDSFAAILDHGDDPDAPAPDSRLVPVSQLGVEIAQSRRDSAAESERVEAVYGR